MQNGSLVLCKDKKEHSIRVRNQHDVLSIVYFILHREVQNADAGSQIKDLLQMVMEN